ncbi:hypothetical protein [Yersinia hibernica]|uniref:Uncharacterized protein n=1 Tax=Yersinia enterocolitica LC20 TaxID=1443113 RepID=A0A7U4GDG1_YEREN|nr:hypothetical protein [Yersinia hibernica]AHM72399.1 hypothetical protein LC20_01145 [Yersinia hibernica]
MTIREITLICYGLACYLYLGYCFASIIRQLNLMKKDTPRTAFIILILFWPAGMMIFEDYLAANEDDINGN